MNRKRNILIVILIISCGLFAIAEEQPLDLTWARPNVEKVYVPPGSAVKYLGELFVQLNINGGVHIGPSFGNIWLKRYDMVDNREGKPGDPDYCKEFLCKADSVKGVLDSYCKGKNIFWEVQDNTVNMFTGDVRPGMKNILDTPLDSIKIERGDTISLVLEKLVSALTKKAKGKKEFHT